MRAGKLLAPDGTGGHKRPGKQDGHGARQVHEMARMLLADPFSNAIVLLARSANFQQDIIGHIDIITRQLIAKAMRVCAWCWCPAFARPKYDRAKTCTTDWLAQVVCSRLCF